MKSTDAKNGVIEESFLPEEDPKFTKESLTEDFKSMKKVKVIFIKKDGSMRTMVCTKDNETIPKEFMTAKKIFDKPSRPTPDHLFPVFDLENNGMRSFTIANVISVESV